jgi:hypothetical protein
MASTKIASEPAKFGSQPNIIGPVHRDDPGLLLHLFIYVAPLQAVLTAIQLHPKVCSIAIANLQQITQLQPKKPPTKPPMTRDRFVQSLISLIF